MKTITVLRKNIIFTFGSSKTVSLGANTDKVSQRKMANSRGLMVKAEDSRPRGPGFKPPIWRPFFRHHSFGSKLGIKFVEKV
jgi:hypothetical protein